MGKTYTMPQYVKINVEANCRNRTRTDISSRGHEMIIDEPPSRHGNDEGFLPLEALIASLAGCSHVVANLIAVEEGFRFEDSHIDVTGKFDTRCFTGDAEVPVPFPEIVMRIQAKTNATDGQLEELRKQLQWRCPVYATFKGCGTNIIEDWVLDRS